MISLILTVTLFGIATGVFAQKSDGTLKRAAVENPRSASIHEELQAATVIAFSPVLKNHAVLEKRDAGWRNLAFIAGEPDRHSPSATLLAEVKKKVKNDTHG
jgi:hypothetical protein